MTEALECERPRGTDITVGRPVRNGKRTQEALTHSHGCNARWPREGGPLAPPPPSNSRASVHVLLSPCVLLPVDSATMTKRICLCVLARRYLPGCCCQAAGQADGGEE